MTKRGSDLKSAWRHVVPPTSHHPSPDHYVAATLFGYLNAWWDPKMSISFYENAKSLAREDAGTDGVLRALWAIAWGFECWAAHCVDWEANDETWPYIMGEVADQMVNVLAVDPGIKGMDALHIGDWRRASTWFTKIAAETNIPVKHTIAFAEDFVPPKQDAPEQSDDA